LFFEQISGILCDKTREVLVSDFARWPNYRLDCRVGKQISSKQTEADKFNSKVNQVIYLKTVLASKHTTIWWQIFRIAIAFAILKPAIKSENVDVIRGAYSRSHR